jgi:hypothetical protein
MTKPEWRERIGDRDPGQEQGRQQVEQDGEQDRERDRAGSALPASWRSELLEGLAVWLGILTLGLATAALAPAAERAQIGPAGPTATSGAADAFASGARATAR